MARYTGVEAKTVVLADDNFGLDAIAGESGRILDVGWGGEVTTSTAMRTRLARSSGGTVPVSGDVQKRHPNSVTNVIQFVDGWTVQPTLTAGFLIPVAAWNAHGGTVRWLAAPGEEIEIIGAEQISCREELGAIAASFGATWDED